MAEPKKIWGKLFLGFGALTIISGIYLVVQGDYVVGISGALVGALIIFQNLSKSKQAETGETEE